MRLALRTRSGSLPGVLLLSAWLSAAMPALAVDEPPTLKPCRLEGMEHEAMCGSIARPLDPARPAGPSIAVQFAVVPALARRKAEDAVFFFAGGPGQSAIDLAGALSRRYARFGNRRDMVFVDQRGTGRSAPLKCADDNDRNALQPLTEALDEARRLQRTRECASALQKLPHGDLRQYTTTIAMADIDAVRAALGVPRINAIGASYGTRAVLEYQRLFPQRLRRAVIDGVAPPDMVLPLAFSTDNQAALEAMFSGCESDGACRARFPTLREQWRQLLASLPQTARVPHPMTGGEENVTITRDTVLGAVRSPLYSPLLASALPAAIAEAAQRRFAPLLGLATALGGKGGGIASGMHYSVICAEDAPRMSEPGGAASGANPPGADFGASSREQYARVCADWPRGAVPPEFYRVGPASAATLVLSGGLDPVTPPRHGERVARLLGAKARHVLVPNAGHGVLGLACMRDAVVRFVDAESDDDALKVDASCSASVPRPSPFMPLQTAPESPR
jgi:pimeloyl-ACP methyl ester carboxylesterase